jgi:hypothetical protein
VRIDRPANTETCANERCGHPFGAHYLSHDGQTSGCSVTDADPQQSARGICLCTGFLVRYMYKPRQPRASKAKP